MLSSESTPRSTADSTGTPITGSAVCAATMPGRWAAPPAPAITTRTPRPAAAVANSASNAGVRWADTTRHSRGTPNSASVASACRIVAQSDVLPITTATNGTGSAMPGGCYRPRRRAAKPGRLPNLICGIFASLGLPELGFARENALSPVRIVPCHPP